MRGRVVVGGALAIAAGVAAWLVWGRGGSSSRDAGRAEQAGASRLSSHGVIGGGGVVAGRVVDEAGAGMSGALVCAIRADDSAGELGSWRPCASSADDGTFRLDGLRTGRYLATATLAGYVTAAFPDPIDGGRLYVGDDEPASAELTLRRGGVQLAGTVSDINGGPIEGAQIATHRATTHSAADGSFALTVAPGPYVSLVALADGYARGGAAATVPGPDVAIRLIPESAIAGRVLDAESGEPVPGALVSIEPVAFGDSGAKGQARGDAEGRFRVGGLQPGRYELNARAPGAYGDRGGSVLLGVAETLDGIDVIVRPARTVSGTVRVDGSESACAQGYVSAWDRARGRSLRADLASDGSFVFEAVPPASYDVSAWCPGGLPPEAAAEPLVVGDDDLDDVALSVRRAATIMGSVVDAGGRAVSGQNVSAMTPGAAYPTALPSATEADGRFVLHVEPGRYQVIVGGGVQVRKLARDVEVTVTEDAYTTPVEVVLELAPSATIRGVVVDDTGERMAGVHIRAVALGDDGQWVQFAPGADVDSGNDGAFELTGLPGGHYSVFASGKTGYASTQIEDGDKVLAEEGAVADVRIVVPARTGRIRGRVVDADGAPIADAFVSAAREGDLSASVWGWDREPQLTDVDGAFEIERLEEGTYTVRAYRRGGGEAIESGVTSGGQVTLSILATGSIAGTARAGGAVPASLTIQIESEGRQRRYERFRDSEQWELLDLPPGTYTLLARDDARNTARAEVELAPGERRTEVVLELVGATATVTGRAIELETGKPAANVRVATRWLDPGYQPEVSAVTGSDGTFTLANLAAGRHRVAMWADGRARVEREVTCRADAIELGDTLVPPARATWDDAGSLGFQLERTSRASGPFVVREVSDGGPAQRAGLRVGDEIVAIDGHDVTGDTAYLFYGLVLVRPGTSVELGLARGPTVVVVAGEPSR